MFISGGENVHPEEIEQELLNIAEIENAVVVDIPDKEFGARPVAFIDFNENKSISSINLNNKLSESLPRFKLPVAYLPLTKQMLKFKPDCKLLKKIAYKKIGII
jgi:O-succinylbenzoic acid--CoA ligase